MSPFLTLAALVLATQTPEPVLVLLGTHPYAVSSRSMAPTLDEGDVVVANRARSDCGTTTPAIGDVVIVDQNGVPWVRRVVAGPGQTVQMIGGVLMIDGQPAPHEEIERRSGEQTRFGLPEIVLRETLGDRSYLTIDYGPGLDLDETPLFVVPDGHWFTMGDSRDNAVDDRVDGPTPAADLCGVVLQIIRAKDPAKIGTRP